MERRTDPLGCHVSFVSRQKWKRQKFQKQAPEVFCKKGVLRSCRPHEIFESIFSYRAHPGDCFQNLKIMSDKFQIFSDWYFRIKFSFKCEIFFQLTPEILFMFLSKYYKTTLISGHTASLQLSIRRLVIV